MTFLGLSALQTLLLALVTTGAVVAMYFLKLRHRRVLIASSLLWKRVLEDRKEHSLFERLRWILSILLAVTIALMTGLSLSRPTFGGGGSNRTVIVLDTSASMAALTADGRARWDRAADRARQIIDRGGTSTEFRVTDTSDRVSTAFTGSRRELLDAISRMRPVAMPSAFPRLDPAESSVFFLTDGVSIPQVPREVVTESFFEDAANVGITAFEIRSLPSSALTYEAYLEVQNFSTEMRPVAISIAGPGGQRITRNERLNAGQIYRESIDLSSLEGGAIRATAQAADDSLAADDVAYAYLPVRRKTRTLLVTRGNSYLERLLELDTHVTASRVTPDQFRESNDIDAYVFDRFAPAAPPRKPALIIGMPDAPWLPREAGSIAKPAISSWVAEHPVMQFVPVHDVSIERAGRIRPPEGTTVLASSGQQPLIVAAERPVRWIWMAFDLDATDFPLQVGFPVFVDNVLAWFGRERLAIRSLPGSIEIPLSGASLRTIDGKDVPTRQHLQRTVFETTDPGLFVAEKDNQRMHIAVNVSDRRMSDVNASIYRNGPPPVAAAAAGPGTELWWYMLLIATLLAGIEWFTYHRRITV